MTARHAIGGCAAALAIGAGAALPGPHGTALIAAGLALLAWAAGPLVSREES